MDKGFYSKKNVDDMLERGHKFVIAMPFSSKLPKSLVDEHRETIDVFKNVVIVWKRFSQSGKEAH